MPKNALGEGIYADFAVPPNSPIRVGDLVQINATTGLAEPMAGAANLRFAGVAVTSPNSANTIVVQRNGTIEVDAAAGVTFLQADIGTTVYAESATTVGKTATSRTAVGTVVKVLSPTRVRIDIRRFTF